MRFSGRRLTMQNLRASSCGVQETSGHHSCRPVHFDEYRNRASQRAGSRDHRQCCNEPRRPSAGNTPQHARALHPQHRRNHRAIDSFHSTRPAAPVGSAAKTLQSARSKRNPRTQTPKHPEHRRCGTIFARPSARDALRLLHRSVKPGLVQRGDELLGAEISLNLK